jgi:hypothetical protein
MERIKAARTDPVRDAEQRRSKALKNQKQTEANLER